ncbi:hypothetical protein BDC45DRAFT_534870 [Circinella umbellata]|nr:hypothetical protein BDC45DRAFT_534870 [Circinella umbellata]
MRTDINTTAQIDAIAHLATFTRARFVNSNLNAPDITRLINQLVLRNSQQSLVQELKYINCYGANVASIIKAVTICTLKKFRICGSSRLFKKKKDMNKLSSALGSNTNLISIVLEDIKILDDADIENLSKSTTLTSIQFRRVSGYSKKSASLFDNHVPRNHFSTY